MPILNIYQRPIFSKGYHKCTKASTAVYRIEKNSFMSIEDFVFKISK